VTSKSAKITELGITAKSKHTGTIIIRGDVIKKRIARQAAKSWVELTKGLETTANDTPEYASLWVAESSLYEWLTSLPDDLKDDLRGRFFIEI
jgi:hypothetical protein